MNLPKETKEILEALAPELAESEDERIIVRLIEYFQGFLEGYEDCYKDGGCVKWEGLDVKSILAWLEKQKDLDKMIIVSPEVWDNAISDAYENGKKDDDKQKEQKHPNGCFTCDEYKKGYEEGRRNGFTAGYNKAMKEVEQKEQKPAEWSKNDTVFLNEITDFFENKTVRLQHDLDMYAHWLKSLPERFNLQPKQEWSDEDEDMLNCCISSIEEAKENRYAYKETDGDTSYDREIDWLKSLRPQPHWEPSEEQMNALRVTLEYMPDTFKPKCTLITLQNDLKKL